MIALLLPDLHEKGTIRDAQLKEETAAFAACEEKIPKSAYNAMYLAVYAGLLRTILDARRAGSLDLKSTRLDDRLLTVCVANLGDRGQRGFVAFPAMGNLPATLVQPSTMMCRKVHQ